MWLFMKEDDGFGSEIVDSGLLSCLLIEWDVLIWEEDGADGRAVEDGTSSVGWLCCICE